MKKALYPLAFSFIFSFGYGQSTQLSKAAIKGHIETLNLAWIQKPDSAWTTMNTIYNRIDFNWYPANSLTFNYGMRNIIDYGQLVTFINDISKISTEFIDYNKLVINDRGFMDMTWKWASGSSYSFYCNIDRLNFDITYKNLQVGIGRQRINWGINMVWTPNDIVNTYNYFNCDYVERPGCDAVRVQYYTGMTSWAELAFKIDNNDDITMAALYKFNYRNYDWQFLGGVMNNDIVLGMGWTGQIKSAGFNGEMSYFAPRKTFGNSTGVLVASAGFNYSFKNNLYIQSAFLLNTGGATGKAGTSNLLASGQAIDAKNLSRARYSIFAQATYPITPLLYTTLATMLNPNDNSSFIGPSVEFNVKENLSFLVLAQIFNGKTDTEFGDYGTMIYSRLKWSF